MSLRHALLGLLADRPASGYDLAKRLESSAGFAWSAKHTQIYPELNRLADGGLVEVAAEGARGRKEYRITDAGRAEVRRWLRETTPDRTQRDDSLLRVFFLWLLEPDEAAAFLRSEADVYRSFHQRLRELDAAIAWDLDDPSDLYGRLALERGLRTSDALAGWADWAAGQVSAPHPPG